MAIRGDGYSMPSKTSARMSDGPHISEVYYLMQRCEVSFKPWRGAAKNWGKKYGREGNVNATISTTVSVAGC